MGGNKTELIARILEVDSEGKEWTEEARAWQLEDSLGETALMDRAGNASIRQNEVSGQNYLSELELIQRERQLIERERALWIREREIMAGSPSISSERGVGTSVNIKAIGELLNDFNGIDQSFVKWEKQVRLLRSTYELDDKATKILIVSHLKGKVQAWFYSKPEILESNSDEILE